MKRPSFSSRQFSRQSITKTWQLVLSQPLSNFQSLSLTKFKGFLQWLLNSAPHQIHSPSLSFISRPVIWGDWDCSTQYPVLCAAIEHHRLDWDSFWCLIAACLQKQSLIQSFEVRFQITQCPIPSMAVAAMPRSCLTRIASGTKRSMVGSFAQCLPVFDHAGKVPTLLCASRAFSSSCCFGFWKDLL